MVVRHENPVGLSPKGEEVTVLGGPWMRVDGVQLGYSGQPSSALTVHERSAGFYDYNSGWIAVGGLEGQLYVAPYTKLNYKLLQEAGFQSGSVSVPFSGGGYMTGEIEAERARCYKMADFQQHVDYNMINVTGKLYIQPGSDPVFEVTPDFSKVGTYNTAPSGVLVAQDMEGRVLISSTKKSPGVEQRLLDAGYRKDETLEVPFALGEKPVQEVKYGKGFEEDRELATKLRPITSSLAYASALKAAGISREVE